MKQTETAQAGRETEKTERDIYLSLSRCAEHYDIQPMQTRDFGYPYNIALAIWDMESKLKERVKHWDNIRLIQNGRKTYFTSEDRCNTSTLLYYIPVVPLYRMLKDPKRKHAAHLLLSVCSYLYNIADVPYYRDEGSYLYWEYEMISEWVELDDETAETQSYWYELHKAAGVGDHMERKISSRTNLKVFKQRLNAFKSRDGFDHDCWMLACKVFALYGQYPKESIFRKAKRARGNSGEDDYDEVISMEKYISFYADNRSWLSETLKDCVNNDFNEYGEVEEPCIRKCFDGSALTNADLDFEDRLFSVLDDLCYLLNNYKHATR